MSGSAVSLDQLISESKSKRSSKNKRSDKRNIKKHSNVAVSRPEKKKVVNKTAGAPPSGLVITVSGSKLFPERNISNQQTEKPSLRQPYEKRRRPRRRERKREKPELKADGPLDINSVSLDDLMKGKGKPKKTQGQNGSANTQSKPEENKEESVIATEDVATPIDKEEAVKLKHSKDVENKKEYLNNLDKIIQQSGTL
jgi:hypothetical protein